MFPRTRALGNPSWLPVILVKYFLTQGIFSKLMNIQVIDRQATQEKIDLILSFVLRTNSIFINKNHFCSGAVQQCVRETTKSLVNNFCCVAKNKFTHIWFTLTSFSPPIFFTFLDNIFLHKTQKKYISFTVKDVSFLETLYFKRKIVDISLRYPQAM